VSVFSIGQEQTPSQTTQSQNPNLTQEKVSKQNKIEKRVKPIRPVISKESPKKEENPAEKQ
jgi:hypothetical protein